MRKPPFSVTAAILDHWLKGLDDGLTRAKAAQRKAVAVSIIDATTLVAIAKHAIAALRILGTVPASSRAVAAPTHTQTNKRQKTRREKTMLTLYIPGPRGHARPFVNDHDPTSSLVFEGTTHRQLEDLPAPWQAIVENAEALRAACYASDPPENDALAALVSGQGEGIESMEALELLVHTADFAGTIHGDAVSVQALLDALKLFNCDHDLVHIIRRLSDRGLRVTYEAAATWTSAQREEAELWIDNSDELPSPAFIVNDGDALPGFRPSTHRHVRGAATTTPMVMTGEYMTRLVRSGIDLAVPEATTLTVEQQEQIRRGDAWIEGDTANGLRLVTK